MKKIILGFGVLAVMASCGGSSAEDVNIADVKDACGCADGFLIVANDVLDAIGDKSEDDMENDEELAKLMKPKMDKLDELEDKCRGELKVKLDEMKKCEPELEGVMKKFEQKF